MSYPKESRASFVALEVSNLELPCSRQTSFVSIIIIKGATTAACLSFYFELPFSIFVGYHSILPYWSPRSLLAAT